MLDFFLHSPGLLPCLEPALPVFDVPWSPHIGLQMEMRASPLSVRVRKLVVPYRLPMDAVDDMMGDPVLWDRCKSRASEYLVDHCDPDVPGPPLAVMGCPYGAMADDVEIPFEDASARKLSESLATISLASEIYVLGMAGVPEEDWQPYLGRGQFPTFRRKKPFHKRPEDSRFADDGL